MVSRKFFHFLGYFFFAPGIVYEPLFTLVLMNVSLVLTMLVDYIRLQWPRSLSVIGKYYTSFTPPNVHGKFVFAPLSLLGGCVLPLEFLWFVTSGRITAKDFFFATCGVSFLTLGDSFVTAPIT
eukprot:TRINITY_DN2171_c0_g1_i22.p2 TRINITY_DN2171_c0_g1~~TRINITY_DN2171_c0_g1_i22.p2  ORF type:complete len:124 (-),score=20.32 TRINITY_DN2171_c0_g1_i22:182-553(-)